MLVNPLGRVIEVRLLQSLNAEVPIELTLFGMTMETRPLQPENADAEMLIVPGLNEILVFLGMVPLYL